jgi:hypothetical protein
MSQTLALLPLPDLPNKVHGIVQLVPFVRVQCDGCGFIYDGPPGKVALGVILSDILFNPRRYSAGDRRRLCRSCRSVEWPDVRGGAAP